MRRGFQAAQFGSQPELQFNTYNKLHLDNWTDASPVIGQTFSQRSAGNGVGLQRGTNPGTPSMSQLGGMSQTQQQAYSNRPLSSGFIPTSQPALSGVFRPGSAPQRPTPSQLDIPTGSQWTQPAVTSNFGGQGHKSSHQGGLLQQQQQQLTASNQSMLRPKQVSLLRTTAAAPHLQARPGSAPGLLSGAQPSSSPAQTPHQYYNQPPSHLQASQQQQQHFHGSHNQQHQRYQNQQGSQGVLGANFNLLGSQQQPQESPIKAQSQQQGNFGGVMTVDDGSAGTGVALGSDLAAVVPAGPTQQQQRQVQPVARTSAGVNRLGPRLRALLQELPPASQKPKHFDLPPEDAVIAPADSNAIVAAAPGEGYDKTTAPAAASNAVACRHEAPPTAAATTAAPIALQLPPQPALDTTLVLQRISSLENHCSSMSTIIQRDIPLLLQQQDSNSLQLQSMKDGSAKGNAALEARLQELASSVASFMDGLRDWQLQQQQQMQQLQEQTARQQPQLVLSHVECQTSPGLLLTPLQQANAIATARPVHAVDDPAAEGSAGFKPATQPVFSPSGKRYVRESDVNKPAEHTCGSLFKQGINSSRQGLYGVPYLQSHATAAQYQLQLQQQSMLAPSSPSATAAAAGTDQPGVASTSITHAETPPAAATEPGAAAEARQDVDNTGDQDGQGTADALSPQQEKPTRVRRKPARRARKPAAKPRGKAAAAAAKAHEAEAAAAPAVPAAVNGSGKQPSSSLVQTKLNFGKRRMTRSVAAKDAAAVEAAVTASLVPEMATATAAAAAAADVPPQLSPATGPSTDVYVWKDGGAAAPAVDADRDAPPAWLMGNDDAAPEVNGKHQQQRSSGRPMSYAGGAAAAASDMRQQKVQGRNKQQHQQQVLMFTDSAAAASGTAAAASGAGRQFQRRTTPPPAACMTTATGSGMQRTVAAGPAAQLDMYSEVPGSPTGPTAAATRRQPGTSQLPPTQFRRGPAAAPMPATAVNRDQQRPVGGPGVAAAAGSGYGRQAPAKLPPGARSGASMAAAAVAARAPARPTHSGFTRPTYSIQQHQCAQPLASGGTSRLLGMKRDRPEPAAPARSSVQMLFGDMDSDSMDCVTEAETLKQQQQMQTGRMPQVADAHHMVNASAAVSSRRSAVANADVMVDEDDLAQQVAARMAQHRNKQRRIAQGSGFAR